MLIAFLLMWKKKWCEKREAMMCLSGIGFGKDAEEREFRKLGTPLPNDCGSSILSALNGNRLHCRSGKEKIARNIQTVVL